MGKIKLKSIGKGISKIGKIASNIPGVGGIVGKGVQLAGGLLGGRGGRKRRSRGININKYANKVIKAKMSAKLMKIKLSSIKGI